jgi:hypothetical protein
MASGVSGAERGRSRRSGCWWIALAGVGVVALIGILVCAGFFISERQAGQTVERELARLRALGEPTTAEELDAFYARPPADQDVTPLLLAALAPLEGPAYEGDTKGLPIVGEDIPIPPPGQPWKEQAAVEKLLAKYAESLKNLHEAARRGGAARYPVKFQDGQDMLLPHAQSLRQGARLLKLEAHVRAHRGDAHGAAESILAIIAAGESLREEPILVCQLVRIALQGIASDTVEKLLPRAPFSEADLVQLQARFQGLNCDEGVLRALLGERVTGLETIPGLMSNLGGGGSPGIAGLLITRNHLAQTYLESMDEVIAAARQPLPGRLDEVDALEAEMKQFVKTAGPITKLRRAMAALTLPAVQASVTAGARANATAQVTATGIAAHRWRLKHGKLPPSLQTLVPDFLPAVPADPFDGKPLRWVIKGDELVVYSIGQNRVDDGGTRQVGLEGDVVFALPR